MMIKRAEEHDLAYIILAGNDFFAESNWYDSMTLSKENIRKTLVAMFNDDNCIIVVAYDDGGDVAGFTLWSLQNPWTVEKIAIEDLFYVRPQARHGNIAKPMLDFAIQLCKDSGAKLLYSTSTAGFDDNGRNARAYNILLRRSGFNEMPHSKFLIMNTEA